MLTYILRRFLIMIPILIAISIFSFIIIKLPPGDYLTSYIQQMKISGQEVDESIIKSLERRYGLNQPGHIQYLKWVSGFFKGDFGMSFQWNEPVLTLIKERIGFTVIIASLTILFQWGFAIPIGILSAIRQYSFVDYFFTFVGFIGLSIPNFLLALILMFFGFKYFGANLSGLFSSKYMGVAWNIEKFIDMLKHLWIPIIVVGTAGTAGLIRIMRGQMLDELEKEYVQTARSKGLSEKTVIFKHTVRIAINPLISTVGWILPQIISGATIVGVVLTLPTLGPTLLQALQYQDMYLAGSILLFQSSLIVI